RRMIYYARNRASPSPGTRRVGSCRFPPRKRDPRINSPGKYHEGRRNLKQEARESAIMTAVLEPGHRGRPPRPAPATAAGSRRAPRTVTPGTGAARRGRDGRARTRIAAEEAG